MNVSVAIVVVHVVAVAAGVADIVISEWGLSNSGCLFCRTKVESLRWL